jgi:SAM-dependent methyltransferase
MSDLRDTYNKIAEDWHCDHHDDDWWHEGTDKYISFFKPGDTVLDVGCGTGVKSKYLLNKGLNVTGIDFSEKLIAIAMQDVPTGCFFLKDIYLPLGLKQQFDGAFAQAVLLHFPKKEIPKILSNILEPLKAGGYFYIALKEKRPEEKEEGMVMESDYGYEYERFFSYFNLDEVKKYLTDAGLEIAYENVAKFGRRNWIQVIAKKI